MGMYKKLLKIQWKIIMQEEFTQAHYRQQITRRL